MAATISTEITKVVTGGPYTYTIFKDGIGQKVVTGLQNAAAAFNGARDDVVALIPQGESVEHISQVVSTR